MDPMQGAQKTAEGEPGSSSHSETSLTHNLVNPIDSPFPNHGSSTLSGRSTYMSSGPHDAQNHCWLSAGESSSRSRPSHQINGFGLKTDHQIPPEHAHNLLGYASEVGHPGITSIASHGGLQIGRGGSNVRNVPPFLQGSSSNRMSSTVNPSFDVNTNGGSGQSSGVVLRHDNCGTSLGGSSRVGEGSSSSSSSGPGSSLGGWGPSCKRKALEGASGHSFPGESSPGCFLQAQNGSWHTGFAHYDGSSGLASSVPSQSCLNIINPSGQPEPRFGLGGGRVVAANAFPSTRTTESSSRPERRLNLGQPPLDSVPLPSADISVGPGVSPQQNVPMTSPFIDPLFMTSTASITGDNHSNIIHLPALTRNIHHLAWNAASSSRTNGSSGLMPPGERFGPPRDVPRSNMEHPMFPPTNEIRNPLPDQSIWSFSRGNRSVSGDSSPFIPRAGPTSGIRSLQQNPAWISPQNTSMLNPLRTSEPAPWSLFSSVQPESASHRASPLPIPPTGPPPVSSNETSVPSGSSSRSHRPRLRRSGHLLDRQNDLLHLRQLGRSLAADSDGRNRLISEIRQVLSAMRRGENLRFEDYMVFDPLIYHGMAEMHDRHRDMRLDVDNMSYEELLALEERIGDVNTGLSEEAILKAMKRHKYASSDDKSHHDTEPCCICQEEYKEGDELGTLDCGHEFHTECIKQWVVLKNLCPICKTVALST